MDYAYHGDLYSLLSGPMPERVVKYYMKELFQTIQYIHDKDIVHLDIKAENLLVDSDFNLILTDFALSEDLKANCSNYIKQSRGTTDYFSPQ
jgi:serine/threonine protein kinase